MQSISHRALATLALATLTSLCACLDSDHEPETGTIGINLVGQSAAGVSFRLRDALITVQGPTSTQTWNTEDAPDVTALSANVVVGGYTALLQPGWRLERLVAGSPPATVAATLMSPNPAMFAVAAQQRTAVPLRFRVDGAVVDMSQGYDITVEVEDPTTSVVTTVSSLMVAEGGSTTVGVRLTSAPTAPVTVQVTSSDAGAATASPSTLTFTPVNYAIAQTVTVTGVQDADAVSEMVTLSIGAMGGPTATVAVSVADDDVVAPSIVSSVSNLALVEGSAGTLTVRLSAPPLLPLTVTVASASAAVATVTPASLVFTAANYNVAQTVTVTGTQDTETPPVNGSTTLTLSAPGLPTSTIAIAVTDDDVAAQAIITSTTNVSLTEGGAAFSVGVRLASPPATTLTMQVVSSDVGAVTVSPATLTFTAANYATAQQVTISSVQDANLANEMVTVSLTIAGGPSAALTVAVLDDDVQSIVASVASLTVGEGTGTMFSVRLAAPPAGSVTVSLASSNTAAVTATPASLVFTAANYATAQTVTVSGVQDANLTNEAATLSLTSPGVPSATVPVTVTDDDVQSLVVSPASQSLCIGASGSLIVRLAAAPAATTTVTVASSVASRVAVSPASLAFTAANWSVGQIVSLDGLSAGTASVTVTSPGVTTVIANVTVLALTAPACLL